jgi:hypothetical protein
MDQLSASGREEKTSLEQEPKEFMNKSTRLEHFTREKVFYSFCC